MFEATLDLFFPENIGDLFKAVLIRHDLVHRNGKMKDSGEHDISEETVRHLIAQTRAFVTHIDVQWTEKAKAVAERNSDF